MKNLHGGDQIAAAASYFPLFGWIIGVVIKKDDDLCYFHGRQSMKLNLSLVALYFVIWLLEHFPLFSWAFGANEFLNPITSAISMLATFLFLGLSAFGAFKAFSEELWEIPYLNEYVDRVLDQISDEDDYEDESHENRDPDDHGR